MRGLRAPQDERGQSLVEMALVLPVLVLLMLVTLDFGRVFFGALAMTNASRVGAEFAIDYQLAVTYGLGPDGADAVVEAKMAEEGEYPPFVTGGTYIMEGGNWIPGTEFTAGATWDFTPLTPLMGALLGGPLTIQKVTVLRFNQAPPP